MELEHLVEKITREVMESMKNRTAAGPSREVTPVSTAGSSASSGTVVLMAGSPGVSPADVREAISALKTRNVQVSTVLTSSGGSFDGVKTIHCASYGDASAAVRNAGMVVIMLTDVATVSRLANLTADRFDIEGVLAALESGKQVWGLRCKNHLPAALARKVDGFFKEIEGFGVKLTDYAATGSMAAPLTISHGSSVCSSNTECAGCGMCASNNKAQVQSIVDQGAERISAAQGISMVPAEMAKYIDHTMLKPEVTKDQVLKLCQEARQYKFASCCVNPTWVPTVSECLKGSGVKTCVVIGFPLGANSTVIKEMETRDAVASGADEIDMVINVGALKAGDYDLVKKDIEAVVNAAQGRIVKVILETALLTDEEKVKACHLSKQAGADFVKTSTGFGPGGATAKDIALMRQTVGKYMGVKASGGIRDYPTAAEMIAAGATRIGASASVGIVKGAAASGSGY